MVQHGDRRGFIVPQRFAVSDVDRERAPGSVCTVSGNHLGHMMQVQVSMSYCRKLESSCKDEMEGTSVCETNKSAA